MKIEADEVMLAQEQGAVMRGAGVKKELEGGVGGEIEGTLVLTNHQLIFVATDEREDDLILSRIWTLWNIRLFYSDVEDLNLIPNDPGNLFIPLAAISSVTGHKGEIRPSLEVKWKEAGKEQGRVFIQVLKGRSRKKNLNDWAAVVERLKTGNQKLISIPKAPGVETLEGKIMRILSDMQRKGIFTIEDEVETAFNVKLDADEVKTACDALSSRGLVKHEPDPSGDDFYRKRSPLGDDNFSD